MINEEFRISTSSGISPIEAGFGLVHADTIVATTDDELLIQPSKLSIKLSVGNKTTSKMVKDLGLSPGSYEGSLEVKQGKNSVVSKKVKLLLVNSSQVRRSFGARYGSLEYNQPVVTGKGKTASWESLWKTNEFSDIVVDFDAPYKFVLWRGMSFAPSWAMDNVMTSNFFAETVEPGVYRDCCEMMSDRECRYIHARIIHNSDARVVIHWRYPLNDSDYTICRNQWVDEVFYIYPDARIVRNVTIYLDPDDKNIWQKCPTTGKKIPCSMIDGPKGKRTFNDMEFITVNAPGASSDDNAPPEALSLLDAKDYIQTFCWPNPPNFNEESLPELSEYIFRLNYRHRPGVFVASPANGLKVRLQKNEGMRYEAGIDVKDDQWVRVPDLPSRFSDHIHWPITRGYGTTPLTDRAVYQGRPTHTFLGYANNAPVEVRDNGAVTWSWLSGMAPENDRELRDKVRAWTCPAVIKGTSYDSRQSAYIVDNPQNEVILKVESKQHVIHPTFVLSGCESSKVHLLINGIPMPDSCVCIGIEHSIDSVQTVITLAESIPPASEIVIKGLNLGEI